MENVNSMGSVLVKIHRKKHRAKIRAMLFIQFRNLMLRMIAGSFA